MPDVYETNDYIQADRYCQQFEICGVATTAILCEAFDRGADITFLAFLKRAPQSEINRFAVQREHSMYQQPLILHMLVTHGNLPFEELKLILDRLVLFTENRSTAALEGSRAEIGLNIVRRAINNHPELPFKGEDRAAI